MDIITNLITIWNHHKDWSIGAGPIWLVSYLLIAGVPLIGLSLWRPRV